MFRNCYLATTPCVLIAFYEAIKVKNHRISASTSNCSFMFFIQVKSFLVKDQKPSIWQKKRWDLGKSLEWDASRTKTWKFLRVSTKPSKRFLLACSLASRTPFRCLNYCFSYSNHVDLVELSEFVLEIERVESLELCAWQANGEKF